MLRPNLEKWYRSIKLNLNIICEILFYRDSWSILSIRTPTFANILIVQHSRYYIYAFVFTIYYFIICFCYPAKHACSINNLLIWGFMLRNEQLPTFTVIPACTSKRPRLEVLMGTSKPYGG